MTQTPELPGGSQGASRILQFWLALHWLIKEYQRPQNRGEAAQLGDQTQQFRNQCYSFPSLDCTLDKLFTGQKPLYTEKHPWQSLDRKHFCRRCGELLKGSQGLTHLCTGDLRSSCPAAAHWPHSGAGQALQLPELWVTGSGTARGTRTNNPGAAFPWLPPHPSARPCDSELSQRHSSHLLCFHRVFLRQTLVNEAFSFPLQC